MNQITNLFSFMNLHAWSAWGVNYPDHDSWDAWIKSDLTYPDLNPREIEILPSVSFIPIQHRKKLSIHTKITLYLLNDLASRVDIQDTQLIVGSRFGEMATTIQLLEALGTDLPSSPMTFSRSVLNSAAGLYSIITNNTRTHVAISAIEDTVRTSLIEAIMRSYTSREKVIFLWADDVIPNCFDAFTTSLPSPAGLALLLSCTDSIGNLNISKEINQNPFQIIKQF